MFNNLNTLFLFFENPIKEYNVREYAKAMKITPATASKILKKLHKNLFLNYRKERMLDLYKANIESEEFKDLKIYYNIRKLKESGLINEINRFYLKPAIILFGSASKGLDTQNSDIDLLIITEKTQELPSRKDYEKKINREIQIILAKEIKSIKNIHLINSALNGITLQGEIKWT